MRDEQREAINRLRRGLDDIWFATLYSQEEMDKDIDTVLSLIKEQQDEIEKLKVNLAKSCTDRTLDRETLKNQENENLEALHRAYNEELDKKDKQIDLMARAFKQDDVRTVEEIKQYFAGLVEKE